MTPNANNHVVIVGAGFTGLSAAYKLAQSGCRVTVLETESEIGGLSRGFLTGSGQPLDRIYHHWFTSDSWAMDLIRELGLQDKLIVTPTNTGYYHDKVNYNLSTPMDLLRFRPLPFFDRLRLGLATLRARRISNWLPLEQKTAVEWITEVCGKRVFETVWKPLLDGKFGPFANEISAVWLWSKLKLRGGSRGKMGEERLAYFKGGFIVLLEALRRRIIELGGDVQVNSTVTAIEPGENGTWRCRVGDGEEFNASEVLITLPPPLTASVLAGWAPRDFLDKLRAVEYLANTCLVLELNRSLSKTYWLNVGDSSFPFVGLIEHTNLDGPENYGGRHIIYLSKYLTTTDRLYLASKDELLEYIVICLQSMFPAFSRDWIVGSHLWREPWAQPVIGKYYSKIIPPTIGPEPGLYMHSMAHIYPEDRGSNYAIRSGIEMAETILSHRQEQKKA